jgi:ABC-type hemin transport system ATPase subunit
VALADGAVLAPLTERAHDPYREISHGAQVKVHAIQLVLAALLAGGQSRGRVLVLDELGNSLGEVNKRDVLAMLKQVAEQQQATILGTCQDSVLETAAEVCGELLWFIHASDVDPYNQPTRVWAFDPDRARVELTTDWVRAGRGHV